LKSSIAKDKAMAAEAVKDLEFAKYASDAAFSALVK